GTAKSRGLNRVRRWLQRVHTKLPARRRFAASGAERSGRHGLMHSFVADAEDRQGCDELSTFDRCGDPPARTSARPMRFHDARRFRFQFIHSTNTAPMNISSQKATRIELFNFRMPQMRAFHMSWVAFFSCFFAWFGIAPLMKVVRDDLQLTKEQVGYCIIAS